MCFCSWIIQFFANKIATKLAKNCQGVFKILLLPLVILASLEAMVLVYFGVKSGCVKKVDSEDRVEELSESEATVARIKNEARCRWYFALVCIFLTTLSSVSIGAALLQTNFSKAGGAVAQHDLIMIIIIGALRTLISVLVIGGLLFGTNPEGCTGVYCTLWIFAPITLVLPAISGMLFVKNLNPFRSVNVNIVDEGFGIPKGDTKFKASGEKQSLLQVESKVSPQASDSAV